MKKEPRAEIRSRLLCCAGLAAAATAATAVSVTVTVALAAAAAATETAVRKQDDDNNKHKQAIVTKTTEVHICSSFPRRVESVCRVFPTLSFHTMRGGKFVCIFLKVSA